MQVVVRQSICEPVVVDEATVDFFYKQSDSFRILSLFNFPHESNQGFQWSVRNTFSFKSLKEMKTVFGIKLPPSPMTFLSCRSGSKGSLTTVCPSLTIFFHCPHVV